MFLSFNRSFISFEKRRLYWFFYFAQWHWWSRAKNHWKCQIFRWKKFFKWFQKWNLWRLTLFQESHFKCMVDFLEISTIMEDTQLFWRENSFLFCMDRHAHDITMDTKHIWNCHFLLWTEFEVSYFKKRLIFKCSSWWKAILIIFKMNLKLSSCFGNWLPTVKTKLKTF